MKTIKKITYDSESDIFWILLKNGPSEYSEEPFPGIRVEFDEKANVMGIEIQSFSKMLGSDDINALKKKFDLPINIKMNTSA